MLFGQLECFLAVARLGSMSRAAREMYLAQPTLTARIQALEHELGDQLFARARSGMRLTEAGREFLPYAERAVASVENGRRHLEELRRGAGGQLRLGVLPRVGTYVLPHALEEFSLAHPRVQLSVKTGHSRDILGMVLTEEVQVGLARRMEHPEVKSVPLYQEELVLAVGKGHAFAGRSKVEPEELKEQRLILFDRASGNSDLTRIFFGGAEPDVVELDNVEAAKRMVEQGLGVSFLPRPAVARAVAAGRLLTVDLAGGPKLRRSIVALHRKDLPPTGPAASFLDLAAAAGQGGDDG